MCLVNKIVNHVINKLSTFRFRAIFRGWARFWWLVFCSIEYLVRKLSLKYWFCT